MVANLVAGTPSTRAPSHEGVTPPRGSSAAARTPSTGPAGPVRPRPARVRPMAGDACGGGARTTGRSSGLALPAFGALIAEPLYLLADTAIVGHLGTRPLGGLAIAAHRAHRRRSASSTSSPTPRPARSPATSAPATSAPRPSTGIDGIWLAVGLGLVPHRRRHRSPSRSSSSTSWARRTPCGRSRSTYLRISPARRAVRARRARAAPATSAARRTRGPRSSSRSARTRQPRDRARPRLRVRHRHRRLGVGHGRRAGRRGGCVFVVIVRVRRRGPTPRASGPGAAGHPGRRGRRQPARGPHRVAARSRCSRTTAVAARISDTALAAHQIAFQIWTFLALALDAIAIAGQALVGRYLGADDGAGRPDASPAACSSSASAPGIVARRRSSRCTRPWLVRPVHRPTPPSGTSPSRCSGSSPLLQPVAAAVFVLDGILIGAGDARYLAGAMVGGLGRLRRAARGRGRGRRGPALAVGRLLRLGRAPAGSGSASASAPTAGS